MKCGAILAGAVLVLAAVRTPPIFAEMQTTPPTITFGFVRDVPGVPVPRYTLTLRSNGTGRYEGEALPPATRYGPGGMTPVPFNREMRLTASTTDRIFELSGQLQHFNRTCASKAKNIADTGTKTLTYSGPEGEGSCTYNYTDTKELVALTQLLQGITETLDQGRELDRLHRYDRLGLDAAMNFLTEEAAAGHALELGTIEPTLRSIAEDGEVIARVRAKASGLLAGVSEAGRLQTH